MFVSSQFSTKFKYQSVHRNCQKTQQFPTSHPPHSPSIFRTYLLFEKFCGSFPFADVCSSALVNCLDLPQDENLLCSIVFCSFSLEIPLYSVTQFYLISLVFISLFLNNIFLFLALDIFPSQHYLLASSYSKQGFCLLFLPLTHPSILFILYCYILIVGWLSVTSS